MRNKVEAMLNDGAYLVTGVRVMGTNFWTFRAYARVDGNPFVDATRAHGNRFRHENGFEYEEIGTEPTPLDVLLNAPATMQRKREAFHQERYHLAHRLILQAYPQVQRGQKREGKIEAELDQDPE